MRDQQRWLGGPLGRELPGLRFPKRGMIREQSGAEGYSSGTSSYQASSYQATSGSLCTLGTGRSRRSSGLHWVTHTRLARTVGGGCLGAGAERAPRLERRLNSYRKLPSYANSLAVGQLSANRITPRGALIRLRKC